LANVDLVRQKYSGSDFRFTSQSAHMKQIASLKEHYEYQGMRLQRLYNRRKKKKTGAFGSTFSKIMDVSGDD
jgi:hypothetical protein